MNIGEYIKKLRTNKNFSQRQLALYANISNTEISKIESGKRQNPSPEILKKIAPILGVQHEELMCVAGYLNGNINLEHNNNSTNKSTKLSKNDSKKIDKELGQMIKTLEQQEGLMFNGEPLDDISKQLLIKSLRNTMEMVTLANKKYTPKKYRK